MSSILSLGGITEVDLTRKLTDVERDALRNKILQEGRNKFAKHPDPSVYEGYIHADADNSNIHAETLNRHVTTS